MYNSKNFWGTQFINKKTKKSTIKKAFFHQKKDQIITEEKEALKKEVLAINKRFNDGEITSEESARLKDKAAEVHALNIENKIAILEN